MLFTFSFNSRNIINEDNMGRKFFWGLKPKHERRKRHKRNKCKNNNFKNHIKINSKLAQSIIIDYKERLDLLHKGIKVCLHLIKEQNGKLTLKELLGLKSEIK